ncbi:unnamed protein product [Calypogeia fissa]
MVESEVVTATAAPLNCEAMERSHFVGNEVGSKDYLESNEERCDYSCKQVGTESSIESIKNSKRGYHEKISDSELHTLLLVETDGQDCSSVQQEVDIYDFHPWEIVTKGKGPRYFLHCLTTQQNDKGQALKSRKTRAGGTWKQSSKTYSNKLLETRYMEYLQPGKCGEQKEEQCKWRMREITLPQSYDKASKPNCKKTIWMIFEKIPNKKVKRSLVVPSSKQTDTPEGILQAENDVPTLILRENEHFIQRSLEGLDMEPVSWGNANCIETDFAVLDFDNDTGRQEGRLLRQVVYLCAT